MTKNIFLIVFLFSFLISSNYVFAIGITPSYNSIDYVPNLEASGAFTIFNNNNETIHVKLIKSGDLTEYVSVDTDIHELAPEERMDFEYNIKLPAESEPGRKIIRIGATEVSEITEGIGSVVAVQMLVSIYVPYPPKYIETNIAISGDVNEQKRLMNISVANLGSEDVHSVGKLSVKDYFGNIVYSKTLDGKTYRTGTTSFLEEWLDTKNLTIGLYTTSVVFEYYGEEASVEKSFSIGTPEIVIYEISKDFMKQNQMRNITVKMHNTYGGNINNTFVKFYIKDKIVEVGPLTFEPFQNLTVPITVNTTQMKYGLYKSKLELLYEGNTKEELLDVMIFPQNIDIFAVSLAIFLIIIFTIEIMHVRSRKRDKK